MRPWLSVAHSVRQLPFPSGYTQDSQETVDLVQSCSLGQSKQI